jgi:mono/diheme cytochrome c family protein
VVLIGVLAAACDSHTEQPMDAHELIAHGAHIYLEYCAECHQVDGTGWSTLYPRLAGNPIVTLRDPQPIIETVLYGQGSMTGFREKLDGYDIAAVLSYIRSSWGNDAVPVSYRQIH